MFIFLKGLENGIEKIEHKIYFLSKNRKNGKKNNELIFCCVMRSLNSKEKFIKKKVFFLFLFFVCF